MNESLPLACPTSNTVFIVLSVFSFIVGIIVFSLIKKGKIKHASWLVGIVLLIPLVLWIIDGYVASAQSLYDPDYEFGKGCFTEGIFSQLARINYGIWILLIALSIASILGFIRLKVAKRKL